VTTPLARKGDADPALEPSVCRWFHNCRPCRIGLLVRAIIGSSAAGGNGLRSQAARPAMQHQAPDHGRNRSIQGQFGRPESSARGDPGRSIDQIQHFKFGTACQEIVNPNAVNPDAIEPTGRGSALLGRSKRLSRCSTPSRLASHNQNTRHW